MSDPDCARDLRAFRVLQNFAVALVDANSIEDVLWAVAKTAVAGLELDDCVVYLVDDQKEVLIQVAAHGQKNPQGREIFHPIVIPLGKGIVGSVAATGQIEWIRDTREDPRYILDDEVRLSELAVPIMLKGKVVGVIDTEHPELDFYTEEHLEVLKTVATMATSKLNSTAEDLRRVVEGLSGTYVTPETLLKSPYYAEALARQVKAEYTGLISHELRTPMNGLMGISELLLMDEGLSQDQREMVRMIHDSGKALLETLTSMLEYSQISLQGWDEQVGPLSFSLLCHSVAQRVESLQPGSSVSLQIDPAIPARLSGDEPGLSKVLHILLSDAINREVSGRIILKAALASETKERLMIRFDVAAAVGGTSSPQLTLIGPANPSEAPQIRKLDYGLALAGRVIESLGGRLFSADAEGSRSLVKFELPFTRI